MRSRSVVVVALAIGCGGATPPAAPPPSNAPVAPRGITADDCPAAIDKAIAAGLVQPRDRDEHVKVCRDELTSLACVVAAQGEDAVRACTDREGHADKPRKPRTEIALQLNHLMKNLKTLYITNAAYPVGASATLPDKPCCSYPNHACPVTTAWAHDPIWSLLDFELDEDSHYQYTYAGSASGGTVTATGDPTCSGTPKTYTLTVSAPDGNPTAKFDPPLD